MRAEITLSRASAPRVTVAIPTYNRAGSLRNSIESVLSQSFPLFRLVIYDNASEDETSEVVASYDDSRISYVRSDKNIGMIANFNRAITMANDEFVVLLPDDDLLYRDHLMSTIDVLDRFPKVGVVHTAFDAIDQDSNILERAKRLVDTNADLVVESRSEFLERTMTENWVICFSSAIYRTKAIVGAGGLREDEEPFSDVPMYMRIALDWEFAFLSTPLCGFRLHAGSATATLGSFTPGVGYLLSEHRILRDHRTKFLNDDGRVLPRDRLDRYRALNQWAYRTQEVERLANRAGVGAPVSSTISSLASLIREDPRVLVGPRTWRLIGAQLGGRQLRRAVRRFKSKDISAETR